MDTYILIGLIIGCSLYSLWRTLVICSWEGEVDTGGYALVICSLTPLSLLIAPSMMLVEGYFLIKSLLQSHHKYDTWVNPIQSIVTYLHNKRKEKEGEK